MKATRSFRDLDVWQESMTLVEEIYALSKNSPPKNVSVSHRSFVELRFQSRPISVKARAGSAAGRSCITWTWRWDPRAKWMLSSNWRRGCHSARGLTKTGSGSASIASGECSMA